MKKSFILPFWGDYAVVGIKHRDWYKFGLINRMGAFVVSPIYDEIHYQGGEYLSVNIGLRDRMTYYDQGKWGVANVKGEIIVPLKYSEMALWDDNEHFTVCYRNRWGAINIKEEVVIPFKRIDFMYIPTPCGYIHFKIAGKYGHFDRSGREVILAVYDEIGSFFRDDPDELVRARRGDEWFYVNRREERVLPSISSNKYSGIKINYLGMFDGDYAEVGVLFYKKQKYGVIDKNGTFVVQPIYDKIYHYKERDYLCVNIGKNDECKPSRPGKWGVVNTKGEIIIPLKYSFIWAWADDEHFSVCYRKRWGVINLKEEVVIPFKALDYLTALGYYNGLISFQENGKWGEFDRDGNVVIEAIYDEPLISFNHSQDDWFVAQIGDDSFFVDITGKRVLL